MEIYFLSSPRLQGVAYQGTLSASFTLSLTLRGLPKVYFHFVASIQSRRLSPLLSTPPPQKKTKSSLHWEGDWGEGTLTTGNEVIPCIKKGGVFLQRK